jgi:hypothetical protein
MVKMVAAVTSFVCTAFWANAASAFCIFGICIGGGGGGGASSAPEIDGPGGLAAIALLICVGAVAYRALQRR